MKTKICPNCRKTHPEATVYCDCGYDFETKRIDEFFKNWQGGPNSVTKRSNRLIWLGASSAALFFVPGCCFGYWFPLSPDLGYSLLDLLNIIFKITFWVPYAILYFAVAVVSGGVIGRIIQGMTNNDQNDELWPVLTFVFGIISGAGFGAILIFVLFEAYKLK